MSGAGSTVETVNAAATAIITANSRVQQVTSPRRRCGSCFSMYWCFGSQRHDKRVNSSFATEVLIPGPSYIAPEVPIPPPAPTLPFVAPPSSPASFLPSEPSSVSHSPGPGGLFSLTALSAEAYSPGGPASIFAIGPYAHETQLVSPPVFSTFTTEPSSAPLTPPEPVHLTTPSSPEVPFAELVRSSLDSTLRRSEGHGFQSYQLYPGSPIGNLISPSSVCSGTSSPFPDAEFYSSLNGFSSFPVADPPKLLAAEGLAMRKMIPIMSSRGDGSLVNDRLSFAELSESPANYSHDAIPLLRKKVSFELSKEESKKPEASENAASDLHNSITNSNDVDPLVSQRVSFELSSKLETKNKSEPLEKEVTELHSTESTFESNDGGSQPGKIIGCLIDESYHDLPKNDPEAKEFKFGNIDGPPMIGSNWWKNEDVSHTETSMGENWSFFPTKQSGVS